MENRNRRRRGLSASGAYQLVEAAVSHTAYSVYTYTFFNQPLKTKVRTSYFSRITIQSYQFFHSHAASRTYDISM